MNPAFFIPGKTTMQRALSSRFWGIPLSKALIISVSASAEASSLSLTLIALSAAKAAVLMEPAIAKNAASVLCIHSSPLWLQQSTVASNVLEITSTEQFFERLPAAPNPPNDKGCLCDLARDLRPESRVQNPP